MPLYRYRAASDSGEVRKGEMSAANEADLSRALKASALELLEAKETVSKNSRAGWKLFKTSRKRDARALASACSGLSDMLRAGVPLLEAISETAASSPSPMLRDGLNAAAAAIGRGETVAASFAPLSSVSGTVPIALLSAGEKSGDLSSAFSALSRSLKWQTDMREKLARAFRYPLFLLAVTFGVAAFMMAAVVPQISSFIASLDMEMPWHTRLLTAVASAFSALWWLPPSLLAAAMAFFSLARRGPPPLAALADRWKLALPWAGGLSRMAAAARFADALAATMKGGADLPLGMQAAASTLGNRALESEAEAARRMVLAGHPASQALAGLLPPFAISMLKAGERSGDITASLNETAAHCDREVAAAVERLAAVAEPALTVASGFLLAWIVLAVIGPLYSGLGQMGWTQ